jgi:hypothetical protein
VFLVIAENEIAATVLTENSVARIESDSRSDSFFMNEVGRLREHIEQKPVASLKERGARPQGQPQGGVRLV